MIYLFVYLVAGGKSFVALAQDYLTARCQDDFFMLHNLPRSNCDIVSSLECSVNLSAVCGSCRYTYRWNGHKWMSPPPLHAAQLERRLMI